MTTLQKKVINYYQEEVSFYEERGIIEKIYKKYPFRNANKSIADQDDINEYETMKLILKNAIELNKIGKLTIKEQKKAFKNKDIKIYNYDLESKLKYFNNL